MLCEKCNQKKATVLYRESINGRARALRLCGECTEAMEQAGELEDISAAVAGIASPCFLADVSGFPVPLRLSGDGTGTCRCPLCGATAGEISATGRVGCASCYTFFSAELADVIRTAHGGNVHTGRVSAGYRARRERVERLAERKRQLREAVDCEDFEKAAGLRDEIHALEAEL